MTALFDFVQLKLIKEIDLTWNNDFLNESEGSFIYKKNISNAHLSYVVVFSVEVCDSELRQEKYHSKKEADNTKYV